MFLSGPRGMMDVIEEHWNEQGDPTRLNMERFQPIIGRGDAEVAHRRNGSLPRHRSRRESATSACHPRRRRGGRRRCRHGCRLGICHTCVGRLHAGQVRDLRTGETTASRARRFAPA